MKRSEIEDELLQLRRQARLFAESEAFAHLGNFEFNLTRRRFENCSAGFAGLFELSRKQVLAPRAGLKRVVDRLHPEDRSGYEALIAATGDQLALDFEFRVQNDSGQIRNFFQVETNRYQADSGDTIVAGIVQDTSAYAGVEADYEYRESLALQAEKISELGNFIYDEIEDRYVYASPGCARIYGMTEEEYLQSVDSVEDDLSDVHQEDRARVHREYEKYFHSGEDCRIEFRAYRQDGEIRWIRELLVAIEMKDSKVALTRGVLQDITEQKKTEMELRDAKENLEHLVDERTRELAATVKRLEVEVDQRKKISAELEFLANHDPLTGLPSLRLCMDRLEQTLAEARRGGRMAAVLFLDLDGFKQINDNYGHEAGDDVLKATANRIRAEVRETDTVARIGGDEFLVILSGLPDLAVVQRVANNLVQQVAQSIRIEQDDVAIGASIGIALYPDDARDAESLIRIADQAMYMIKQSGKNAFGFHRPDKLN